MSRVGWVRISRRERGSISRRRRGAELGVGSLGLSHYYITHTATCIFSCIPRGTVLMRLERNN
jgi:hypothetical protein